MILLSLSIQKKKKVHQAFAQKEQNKQEFKMLSARAFVVRDALVRPFCSKAGLPL